MIACVYMKKTYINTDVNFDHAIKRLQENNPGFSKTLLIRFAVRLAAENNAIISMGKYNI